MVFFYGSCDWLTYSMINYGHLPRWLAYLLLIPGALLLGLFPAVFACVIAWIVQRRGTSALLVAPFVWAALEWARLEVTGQLWNAIGYSQAYHPWLIGFSRWGGVYAVGFLIVTVNAAAAFTILRRTTRAVAAAVVIVSLVTLTAWVSVPRSVPNSNAPAYLTVIALQPNVPMDPAEASQQREKLIERHLSLSRNALREIGDDGNPRLVIWPESPMNFTYLNDPQFQTLIGNFAKTHHTSVLFNSQEPAPDAGSYNSALLINEEGRLVAQYDKIRLMPFGEYVPLPRWMPGASLITGLVGDFTPGTKYTLMPVGDKHAGVFICIESAYPTIARTFTAAGADVLINISNDGYLGPTAVMRQHLSNVVFRAVENARPVLRVTNTGITASIRADGNVVDETQSFVPAVRIWKVNPAPNIDTFYSRHGHLFVVACSILSLLFCAAQLIRSRPN